MEQKFPNCMAMHPFFFFFFWGKYGHASSKAKWRQNRKIKLVKGFYKHLSMNSEYKHLRKGNFNTKVDNQWSSKFQAFPPNPTSKMQQKTQRFQYGLQNSYYLLYVWAFRLAFCKPLVASIITILVIEQLRSVISMKLLKFKHTIHTKHK